MIRTLAAALALALLTLPGCEQAKEAAGAAVKKAEKKLERKARQAARKTARKAEAKAKKAAKGAVKSDKTRAAATTSGKDYGAGVTVTEGLTLGQVVAKGDELKGKKIRLDGTITKMCVHRGNWLSWTEGDHQLLVQMKDKAFTIPGASQGKKVQVEGYLLKTHLGSDCEEHQTGLPGGLPYPKGKQVFFAATGIRVLD